MRGLLDRTPLRVKLVAALLALVAFGLFVSGAAATAALRSYLIDRTDDQLRTAAPRVAQFAQAQSGVGRRVNPSALPSQFFVRLYAGGQTIGFRTPDLVGEPAPVPATELTADFGQPFTMGGAGGDWRAVVLPLRDIDGVALVALPLDDVRETTARLVLLELAVGVTVLVVLAGVGYAAVRSSLRPLAEVETTAAAIAAGDLSRRVPDRDPRTEVGRLGRALNGMLGQIEGAFRARTASESQARASEERMRRFVADASHELRTPLTSIRGFAELYRQGAVSDPAEVGRVLRRVEDEAARMGLLVDDLLLLARLDQQRPLERTPVDLLELAQDAVTDARAVAQDREITLRVTGGRPPVVLGDEARLRQVTGNLLTNAVTHTPPGTAVGVTVGTMVEGGVQSAVLDVADSGPGLPAEQAARVFERFYRADAARTRASGGTGLGLSIVAALVAAHGGTVSVDTAPGRGAVFRVRLPLADGTPAPAARVPAGQPAAAPAPPDPQPPGTPLTGSSQPAG